MKSDSPALLLCRPRGAEHRDTQRRRKVTRAARACQITPKSSLHHFATTSAPSRIAHTTRHNHAVPAAPPSCAQKPTKSDVVDSTASAVRKGAGRRRQWRGRREQSNLSVFPPHAIDVAARESGHAFPAFSGGWKPKRVRGEDEAGDGDGDGGASSRSKSLLPVCSSVIFARTGYGFRCARGPFCLRRRPSGNSHIQWGRRTCRRLEAETVQTSQVKGQQPMSCLFWIST